MTGAQRWLIVVALIAGLALVGIFGVRAWNQLQYAKRVAGGEVQVDTLRGWMTLPYIARVYRVPEAELRAVLGLPAQGNDERSLRQWLDASGIEPEAGRRTIESLILSRDRGAADDPP